MIMTHGIAQGLEHYDLMNLRRYALFLSTSWSMITIAKLMNVHSTCSFLRHTVPRGMI
jgi:hypothetical protein